MGRSAKFTASDVDSKALSFFGNRFKTFDIGLPSMSIPTTAIKLIKNPISNKYSGLKSSIAIADIDILESPSFLNPIDFANAAVKVIMLARTVEGEKSHSAQNINKKVDSIAIFAIRLVSFVFLKSQSNAPANIRATPISQTRAQCLCMKSPTLCFHQARSCRQTSSQKENLPYRFLCLNK